MELKIIDKDTGADPVYTLDKVADFLFKHLDRFGDKREFILMAMEYIFMPGKGGFITVGIEEGEIVGAVVINETGMGGYIPENILVYIAVHENMRGKGAGKQLMNAVIERAIGSIALHVEADNPAKYLYEKLGFTNKYLEMRLQK